VVGYKSVESFPFTTRLTETWGVPVLRVSGDIVLATAPRFRVALEKAVEAVERAEGPTHALVVDLSETEFMDTVGLATLMERTKGLREREGEVRVVIPQGRQVRRTLEVTGLVDMFRIYSDVLSAVFGRRDGA
jgi:anti-anti-sigma factor